MTKKHKLSERGRRRAGERAAVDLARDRLRAAELAPGGTPGRPIVVDSAHVIEGQARDLRCAICEAEVILEEHDAVTHEGTLVRRVRVICKECHVPRLIWFRIERPRPN